MSSLPPMEIIVGHWQVTQCIPSSATEDKKGIEGTIFELTDNGQVIWSIPDGTADLPLLHCDTYEFSAQTSKHRFIDNPLIRFGTYRGHVLVFNVDIYKLVSDELVMSKSLCLLIQCKRYEPPKRGNTPFTLLPALEEGYFSDLEIVASNSKVFHVHTLILNLTVPDLDWTAQVPPLSGLREEVLGTILHYLYAQCLPSGLPESTANEIVTLLADVPQLGVLRRLCQKYANLLKMKNSILDLVNKIHEDVTRMTERFQPKSIFTDPAKLCDAVKLSIRDIAIAYIRMVLVCHVYNEGKAELSDSANDGLINFLQSRQPIILRQIKNFLAGVSSTLHSFDATQRWDLACYMLPELEVFLETGLTMINMVQTAVKTLLQQGLKEGDHRGTSLIEQDLKAEISQKDLSRFDCYLGHLLFIQDQLLHRKEYLESLSTSNKIRSLAAILDDFIAEIPVFLLRLEELAGSLDYKFRWHKTQFCFKVASDKICEILRKAVDGRHAFRNFLMTVVALVDRDEFTAILMELNLLSADMGFQPCINETDRSTSSRFSLNVTEELCVPPPGGISPLSLATKKLSKSPLHADMVFEVIEGDRTSRIPAHRVIVAARCDWFRRALLSGMQEDINRRIPVHNSSRQSFRTFLNYLYSGLVPNHHLSCSKWIEMLIQADCYEVDTLKSTCEGALKRYVREDSVVEFLDLADQLNALTLRADCIKFITECQDVLDQEGFLELSMPLQAEVYDAVRLRTGACICRRPGRKKPEVEKREEPEGQEDDCSIYRLIDDTAHLKLKR